MIGISLVVAMLVGQVDPRDPAKLVRQLGSARFAEREAASAALEKLGPAALPALRDAREATDPELRTRAEAIIARIRSRERDRAEAAAPGFERRELKAASLIRLDFASRPLDEVVEGFGLPSPGRIDWHPDTPESVRRRRVTIREPAPVPFWTAIDRLCRAGELRYIPGSPRGPGGGQPPQFCLFLAPGAMNPGPRADSGPLRLELVAMTHSRYVNLTPSHPDYHPGRGRMPMAFGSRQETFVISSRILAEPRVLIRQVGDALFAEAVDDRGQSLLHGPAPHLYQLGYGFGGTGPAHACADYTLGLKYPEHPGKVIKRLKLTIAVEVETLMPDRLEIRLADAVGKAVRHGRISIKVLSVERDSQGHQKVRLTLRTDESAPERLALDRTGALAPVKGRPARPEVSPNVIQVLDQQGRQFPWFGGEVPARSPNDPALTAELTMWPEGGIPIPVRAGHGVVPGEDRETAIPTVLYHTRMAREVIPATFEFHDIPLP